MRVQTFYNWLQREVASSRMALVKLYEQRDKLLYVEAPPLRKDYMDKIGVVETDVMEAELNVAMLEKKNELIQIAVNRGETVDLEEIEAKVEEERKERISETEAADKTLEDFVPLSDADQHTMQRLYQDIIRDFQPSMNPDVSETEKDLYEKAIEAYKVQDLDEIKLIHESFYRPDDEDSGIAVTLDLDLDSLLEPPTLQEQSQARRTEYRKAATALSTDYTLAKKLYTCFAPLEEDAVMLDVLAELQKQRKALEEEIAQIRAGFPFNAAATLKDPKKVDEYLEELRVRARDADAKKEKLEQKIALLLKEKENV